MCRRFDSALGHHFKFSKTMIFLPTPHNIQKAASLLKKEDVVAFPTETVYGLGGLCRSHRAISKIFQTKSRPSHNPLIVHVDSLSQAKEIGSFDKLSEKIVSLFWPGPLTIVVPTNPAANLSPLATSGLTTVAIRFSDHPILMSLLRLIGEPLVAPSANLSGHLSPTSANHVEKNFPDLFILDGGETSKGVESTIVCTKEGRVSILRSGAITKEQIESQSHLPVSWAEQQQEISSPGQLLHHYAPSLPLRVGVEKPREGEAFLGFGPTKHPTTFNLSHKGSLEEAAHNLFSFLYLVDNPSLYKGISVSPIPFYGLGVTINDRLKRASLSRS